MNYRCIAFFVLLSFAFYGQNEKKVDSLNKLIQQAKQTNSWESSIALLYTKGKFYNSEKKYEAAQEQFLKVDSIAKQYNYSDENKVLSTVVRAEISKSTFSSDGTETANRLLTQALIDAKKLNNEPLIYTVYKDLAYLKGLMSEYDESKFYLDIAMPYYLERDDVRSVSRLYNIYKIYYIYIQTA